MSELPKDLIAKAIQGRGRMEDCPKCLNVDSEFCSACNGKGRVLVVPDSLAVVKESRYPGTGRTVPDRWDSVTDNPKSDE